MGWGGFKPEQSNAPTGWGDASNQPASGAQDSGWGKPDLGTKGWGDAPKTDTGTSQWGALPSNTGWGDAPTSTGPNNTRQEPTGWGNQPPSGTNQGGWGGAPGAPPQQQPNSWAQTASKGVEDKPAPNSLSASLDPAASAKVMSNDGWGKTQINQTAKWDVDASGPGVGVARGDDGTAAWGQPQGPPPSSSTRPAWGKDAAPPSAWGNPSQGAPKTPSGWGDPAPPSSQPPPAWGNPNNNQQDNTNQGGRAWVVNNNNSSAPGGGTSHQWGKPPAVPSSSGTQGWGNSSQPAPGPDNGTGAWGRPPPSQWGDQGNQPHPSGPPPTGPPPSHPTGPPPSGPPPTGLPPSGPMPPTGPPPSGIPPSGPPPSGPPPGAMPSGPPPGPPPSVPPPSVPPPSNTDHPTSPEQPRIITGCSWQNMAVTTVATGWGELSPEPPRKISADDGTYVWGDSNEHNMRISHNARITASRQTQVGGRPLSTMQQGDQTSTRPPSQVDNGTSAWGDGGSSNSQWGNVTAKSGGDDGTSVWGAPAPKQGGGGGGMGQWDESSPWGRSSSTMGSTKDSMQTGWNDDSGGGGGSGSEWQINCGLPRSSHL